MYQYQLSLSSVTWNMQVSNSRGNDMNVIQSFYFSFLLTVTFSMKINFIGYHLQHLCRRLLLTNYNGIYRHVILLIWWKYADVENIKFGIVK